MKDRLVSHLNMVFQALSIELAPEVYDCTSDKLPDWACHLSHSYRYFVCTSAVDKLDLLIDKMGIIIENSKEEKPYSFDLYLVLDFIDKTCQEILENLNIKTAE